MFAAYLDFDLAFTELEIREFYWKQRSFDDAFVDWANTFDLLIIGGGNYLELWVERSATGTSIDISVQRLRALRVPTLFYALGVDTGQGYTRASAERFRTFAQTIVDREDMFLCVRNDGSSRALREVVGSGLANLIPVMPDGGFFVDQSPQGLAASGLPLRPTRRTVGINIAGDMPERRFGEKSGVERFTASVAELCNGLLDLSPDIHVELIPHIWRDSQLIAQLLPLLPDSLLRRRVRIAPLDPTAGGLVEFIGGYRNYAMVLGMRFHANVCPIGLGVPTRGLLSYPQVKLLYGELGMEDRLSDVMADGFSSRLLEQSAMDLETPAVATAAMRRCRAELDQQARTVLADIDAWLTSLPGLRG